MCGSRYVRSHQESRVRVSLQEEEEKAAKLRMKREEVERKARRGEIDPMQEHVIQNISQLSGLRRHEIMDFMFDNPLMLEDVDFLLRDESARKLLVNFQPGQERDENVLLTSDGSSSPLTGTTIYFLRLSTKKYLGEETFQRELVGGMVQASTVESLLWSLERTVELIFIPILSNR